MSDKEGAEFSLWGGEIYGKNINVVPNTLLKQEWSSGDNDIPGTVTFTLKESGGVTTVVLVHEGISDQSYSKLADGWKDYYLGPMKDHLES